MDADEPMIMARATPRFFLYHFTDLPPPEIYLLCFASWLFLLWYIHTNTEESGAILRQQLRRHGTLGESERITIIYLQVAIQVIACTGDYR